MNVEGLNGESRGLVHTGAFRPSECAPSEVVSTGSQVGDYSACQFGALAIAFNGKRVVVCIIAPGTKRIATP